MSVENDTVTLLRLINLVNLPPTGELDLEINAHLPTNSDWPEYALKFLIGRIALAIGSGLVWYTANEHQYSVGDMPLSRY